MTTQNFIAKTYGVKSTKERRCSSVFTDTDGNVYSYGYHYPLLFQVGGLWFINRRGYSSTTSKHIMWAGRATDYTALDVELKSDERLTDIDIETIMDRLTTERDRYIDEMQSKKRKDTGVFNGLVRQLDDVDSRIHQVKVLEEEIYNENYEG